MATSYDILVCFHGQKLLQPDIVIIRFLGEQGFHGEQPGFSAYVTLLEPHPKPSHDNVHTFRILPSSVD